MQNVELICQHFKLMLENYNLSISFTFRTCPKHKREKATIYLNFDDEKNIDIKLEREKFVEYVDQLLLRDSGWFVVPPFREYKRHLTFKRVAEFALRREQSIL